MVLAQRVHQSLAIKRHGKIAGFKGMPAKGGNASLSDAAVKAAVEHMVKGSK
jgi:cytochrome c5